MTSLRAGRRPHYIATIAATAVITFAASACGGGTIDIAEVADQADANRATVAPVEPTAVPPTAVAMPDEPTATPLPVEPGSIEDAAEATVKILTQGTFIDPLETTPITTGGIGSGFIISDEGHVVTNNHIVGGAAFLEVYLPGESTPTTAEVLGVSECNDLAVLDLAGDGYPFLRFRTEPVNPGLPIFSAGYPRNFDTDLLAVDYTLTSGIVSTTQGGGESDWTSVDGVIEHDARIRGGNSGGPLIDEQGNVVGINFAGEDVNDLNFAIAAQEAIPTIEQLKSGDVESIGINAQAIVTDQTSGIWVAAVSSGTAADRAGIEAGDLIVSMEGLDLATDGTLATYCDIIRTNGPDDTLSIEVYRLSTDELLEGQLNGVPLSQSFSFADELGDAESTDPYTDYEFISDETNSVGVEVPVEWADRDGSFNEDFGESVWAAPSISEFDSTWDAPGIIVERNSNLTSADIDAVLADWQYDCAEQDPAAAFQTADGYFVGKWKQFRMCGGTETSLVALALSPPDGDQVVRMLIQVVSDRDLAVVDRAIDSIDSIDSAP